MHKIATSPLYHRINQSGHLLIVYIKLIDDVGSDNEKKPGDFDEYIYDP